MPYPAGLGAWGRLPDLTPPTGANSPPRWSALRTWGRPLASSCCSLAYQAMPGRPSGYFFSSGGAGRGSGRALGEGSGSQSRNSWSSVLTVSGHSSITMWLPSSMSFRKASNRIVNEQDGHSELSMVDLVTFRPVLATHHGSQDEG